MSDLLFCARSKRCLFEALIIPLLVFGITAAFSFGTNQGNLRKVLIAVDQNTSSMSHSGALFVQALERCPDLDLVESSNPQKDLQERRIDAVIKLPADDSTVDVYLSAAEAGGKEAIKKLNSAVQSARNEVWGQVSGGKLSDAETKVFTVEKVPLTSSSSVFVEAILLGVGLLMYRLAFSMGFAAQFLWHKESMSKSLTNILVTPVSRAAFSAAKCTVATIISLVNVIVFVLSLMAFVAVLTSMSAGSHTVLLAQREPAGQLNFVANVDWPSFTVAASFSLVLFAVLCAQIAVLAVAFLKTRQLSIVLTYTYLVLCCAVVAGTLPHVKLDQFTRLVPVLNLILMLKSILQHDSGFVFFPLSIAVSLMLVLLLGMFIARSFGSERFILHGLDY